jgi:hypothetical protein
MTTYREWKTIDKSLWGPGPWQNEPDKVQFQDDETGFACLIKRTDGGHLCGYVGVPPNHPAFEKGYDDIHANVHGGLTFADHCQEITEETWQKIKANYADAASKELRFPLGDSAMFRKKWEDCLDNYEKFRERAQAEFICHIPDPGEPDNIWWLGFDCAHGVDMSPGWARFSFMSRSGQYRDIDFVKNEIRNLAKQLKELQQ